MRHKVCKAAEWWVFRPDYEEDAYRKNVPFLWFKGDYKGISCHAKSTMKLGRDISCWLDEGHTGPHEGGIFMDDEDRRRHPGKGYPVTGGSSDWSSAVCSGRWK